jgi:hypothetical protein
MEYTCKKDPDEISKQGIFLPNYNIEKCKKTSKDFAKYVLISCSGWFANVSVFFITTSMNNTLIIDVFHKAQFHTLATFPNSLVALALPIPQLAMLLYKPLAQPPRRPFLSLQNK